MGKRIYVASSWRNSYQPGIVKSLRMLGHDVYDFRNPEYGLTDGFRWSHLDEAWKEWTPEGYRAALLHHPIAALGFNTDLRAMKWADTCVLVMPCGRSAHLELGWCAGAGKHTIIHIPEPCEPELMNMLADDITVNTDELYAAIDGSRPSVPGNAAVL